MFDRLKYLYDYRSFFYSLVGKEFQLRYTQSILGFLWIFIEPAIVVATLSTVFTLIGKSAPGGAPFAIWFYGAILPWKYFASFLGGGTGCFMADKGFMTKIPFPKELSVFKVVAISFIDFIAANVCFIALLIIFGYKPNIYYLMLPVYIGMLTLLGIGTMFLLATIQVYIRDIKILAKSFSTILYWFTPIILNIPYEGKTKIVYYVNPLAGIVAGYRDIIVHERLPPIEQFYCYFVVTTVVLISGYKLFRRYERFFVDVI